MRKILLTTFTLITSATCSKQDNSPPPAPQQISGSAIGHYCSMNLTEYNGLKAQIFLNDKPEEPVWFSTTKQMFGYTKLPGESKDIHVIYVIDMGKVKDWGRPSADTEWIDMKKAYYAIESSLISGMGTEDALPFADKAQAEKFAEGKGGRIVGFAEMSDEYTFK